jgi:hypothetical protein
MVVVSRVGRILLLCSLLCASALAQQSSSSASSPADSDASASSNSGAGESVADAARRMRKDQTKEVQMSPEDAKKLFQAVDKVLTFDSEDTGFPRRYPVKRELVGTADIEKLARAQEAKKDVSQELTRTEMTMKKFGFLPADFNLREFLVKSESKELAGYYDYDTKTVHMLNWVPLERQVPILAHELTHALQDQNYNLQVWLKAGEPVANAAAKGVQPTVDDESELARRAVVEGQATVVMLDFMLAPYGRSVQNTPGIIYRMEDPAVRATYDSELLHTAPMILRESGTFPYRAGLIFEGELLQKGGKAMAFAGAFARPPHDTHEVLEPQAYLSGEKPLQVRLPDPHALLSDKYEVYDSGSIGELDVRALLEQYGDRKVAEELSSQWQGGAYLTFQHTVKNAAAVDPLSAADLALLYVSHWKTAQAATHFARLYTQAVSQRYQKATVEALDPCSGTQCPVAAAHFSTEDGPVIVQQWPDGTVLVSEGFDTTTAAKLRDAVRNASPEVRAENLPHSELGLRLYDFPGFSAYQEQIGEEILGRANLKEQ